MQSSKRLTVDLNALEHNLNVLAARQVPQTHVMPIVKANAYGAGAIPVSLFYQSIGVPILGVSLVSEAILLRENGVHIPLFVIGAFPKEIPEIVHYDLQVALSDSCFAEQLHHEAVKQQKKMDVHLHVNTGMNRLGCPTDEAIRLESSILALPFLKFTGILSHFVAASSPHFDSLSHTQISQFEQICQQLKASPKWIHMCSTSSAIRFPLPFTNLLRIGLGQFGAYSSALEKESLPQLKLALELSSEILAINTCSHGDTVGYFAEYSVKRPKERIAVIPMGYHDGLHLIYSNKGYVLIRGKKAPYVGRITMDYLMVDVTNIPEAQVGDSALIFGKNLPPELVASWGNTNVREFLACLGPRIERNSVYSEVKNEQETLQKAVCTL